jgi:hypothetical protein
MNDFQTPIHQVSRVGANDIDVNVNDNDTIDVGSISIAAIDSSDARFLTPQPQFLEARQPSQPKKKSKTIASKSSIDANVSDAIDSTLPSNVDVEGGNSIFAALFGTKTERKKKNTNLLSKLENDGVLGMTILDEHSHRVHLQQFAGSARQADALAALDAFESFTNIVLPSLAIGSTLHDTLLAKYGNGVLATVATRSMNTVRGRNLLLKFAIDDNNDSDVARLDLEQADVALGAAAALFDFVDSVADVTIDQHSLRVELHTQLAHKMRIDAATASALELVANVVDGSKRATLLGLFSTRTPAGERLLRRELLAPPCDAAEIEMRATAVAELLERGSATPTSTRSRASSSICAHIVSLLAHS